MSPALILACLWVLASAIVAMLPLRFHWRFGLPLLVLSIPVMGFIGYTHGWIWVPLVALAVVSMFRNPLRYFVKRALGKAV